MISLVISQLLQRQRICSATITACGAGSIRQLAIAGLYYIFPREKNLTDRLRQTNVSNKSTIYIVTTTINGATLILNRSRFAEACEELEFKHCKQEFREALKMNFERRDRKIYQYHWDIIDCTTLPYRNETTNCYYPNHDQGGQRKGLLVNRNLSVMIVIFVDLKLVSASQYWRPKANIQHCLAI